MTAVDRGLPELARRHPEWKPWLAVIEEILQEAADPRWDALVPPHIGRRDGRAPLLAGAPLVVDEGRKRDSRGAPGSIRSESRDPWDLPSNSLTNRADSMAGVVR